MATEVFFKDLSKLLVRKERASKAELKIREKRWPKRPTSRRFWEGIGYRTCGEDLPLAKKNLPHNLEQKSRLESEGRLENRETQG